MADEAAEDPEADQEQRLRIGSRERAAALILYYDTSALVKLLIEEEGSELVRKLWGSTYMAVSSILAYPEGRAALAAAQRSGRVDQQDLRSSLRAFEAMQGGLISLGVDQRLAREAGRLAADWDLRGYDAVHLATALDISEEELTFVTWDADLARAAEKAGLAVAGA